MDYKEEIIDHYKHPRNFGAIEGGIEASEANASCGDMVKVYLKIENGKVIKMMWQGVGCAISTAAASMLSEKVEGLSLDEVSKIDETKVISWLGGEVNPGRMKCATLAYKTLLSMIKVL